MEKKIEDYLHLYLSHKTCKTSHGGCVNSNICQSMDRCSAPAAIEMYIFPVDTINDGWLAKQLKKHKQLQCYVPLTIKRYYDCIEKGYSPILRTLSDISEDEEYEICEVVDEFTPLSIEHFIDALKNNTKYVKDIRVMPELFTYLLSKGFDLFGLIESGLAIDKTKIENI